MPETRELTPDELLELESKGVDSSQYAGRKVTLASPDEIQQPAQEQPTNNTQPGIASSILASQKARAGGTIGGGLGGIAGGALGAEYIPFAHMAPPYSEAVAAILGGAIGGFGGSFGGQKAQNAIQGPQLTQQLQQEAQQGEEAHPTIVPIANAGISALASGGKFNLSNIPKALSGDTGAIGKIALNAAINPAINTGLQYATTGQLPTAGELATDVGTGALFSEGSKWASRLQGHSAEPTANVTPATDTTPTDIGVTSGEQQGVVTSPFQAKNADGTDYIDNDAVRQHYNKYINPKPDTTGMSDVDAYKALSDWRRGKKLDVETMRNASHEAYVANLASSGGSSTISPASTSDIIPTTEVIASSSEPTAKITSTETTTPNGVDTVGASSNITADSEAKNKPIVPEGTVDKQNDVISPEEQAEILKESGMNQSPPDNSKDLQDYNEKYAQMKDMISNGDTNSKEFQQVWKDMETIKNRNKGMPPTSSQQSPPAMGSNKLPVNALQEHIQSGKATVGSGLDIIAKQGGEYSKLAKYMLANGSADRMNTPINHAPELDAPNSPYRSHYNQGIDNINLQSSHLNNPFVVTHEAAHALTSKFIDSNPNHPLTKQLESLRQLAVNHLGNSEYGIKDTHEFLAMALGDKSFKDKLDSIKVPGAKKSLWQHVVDTVRSMLGIPTTEHTLLDKALTTSDRIIKSANSSNTSDDGSINNSPLDSKFKTGDKVKSMDGMSTRYESQHPDKNYDIIATGKTRYQEGLGLSHQLEFKPHLDEHGVYDSNKHFSSFEWRPERFIEKDNIHEAPINKINPTGKDLETPENQMGRVSKIFRSVIDRVSDISHPSAQLVADAGKRTLNEAQERYGVTGNKLIDYAKQIGLTEKDQSQLDKISQYENLNKKQAPSTMFTTQAQRKFYTMERSVYDESGKYRLKNNEPVYRNGKPTPLQQDPFAHPTTPNAKTIELYRENSDKTLSQRQALDKEFIDNAMKHGYGQQQAESALKDFKSAIAGGLKDRGGNMQFYNAARRAQGIPLPESFTRQGYLKNLENYYKRQSVDNTFYKHIESNPKVMSALGEHQDAWGKPIPQDPNGPITGNKAVQQMLQGFRGKEVGGNHNEESISSLATTLFVASPALEVHKAVTNLIGATQLMDNPIGAVKQFAHMITNLGEGVQRAKENGILKLTANSVSNALSSNATFAEKLSAIGQGYRNLITAGGLTDRWSTGLMQAGAEYALPSIIDKANTGNVDKQNFLHKLDPDYQPGKTYTTQDISKLASLAAGYIHGTHDARTMPGWMSSDSEFSGFFKLAHWSIAQTNRFMSDMVQPAKNGNYAPLLTGLFGSAIGGYMVKELREKLQGKKGQIPSLEEIANSDRGLSGNKGLLFYNLVAASQYAGFGGLLSQVAKYPLDAIYRNNPQGATFPLDEVATDMVHTLSKVTEAIANDPNINWFDLASEITKHVATTNIQLSRMAYNQAINNGLITGTPAEKKILGDKLNQLRRFDMVEGLPYQSQDSGMGNEFENIEQKKFHSTQDLQSAANQVPTLVNNILQTYHNNPDVMMEKLKALKTGNEYPTFPNMENMPLSFSKYLSYLTREEGPQAAQNELMDYMRHKTINEVKSSMVP